jgi:hypothetical protein
MSIVRWGALLLFFISQPVWATRARVAALMGNDHLLDPEVVYSYPTKMSEFNSYLVIETGQSTARASEELPLGSYHHRFGDDRHGSITLGRNSNLMTKHRTAYNRITGELFENAQNPFSLGYLYKYRGHGLAATVTLAERNDNLATELERSRSMQLGYRWGQISLAMDLGLENRVQAPRTKYMKIIDSVAMRGLYEVDNFVISLEGSVFKGIQYNNDLESQNFDFQDFVLSLSDSSWMYEQLFFYRFDLSLEQIKYKLSTAQERHNKLPLTMGFESKVLAWLTLRASIQQTFILNNTQDKSAAENSTLAAMGLGLHFGKLSVDGTLTGLVGSTANQSLNENQFLGRLGFVYTP